VVYVCYSFCILNEIYIFGYLDFLSLCLFSCLLCATSLEILKTVLNLCSKYPISNNAYIKILNHGSVARNCFFFESVRDCSKNNGSKYFLFKNILK
jgi:hypothetical protein